MVLRQDSGAAARDGQFSLIAVFEFVTICAVLAASTPLLGILTAVCLMLFALALWLKLGLLALAMLVAAILAIDWHPETLNSARHLVLLLMIGLLCAWYEWRRRRRRAAEGAAANTMDRDLC